MYFLAELNTSKALFSDFINGWNKLDPNIRTSRSFNIFYNEFLKFIRSVERKIIGIYDPLGKKILTGLRLGISHLRKRKVRHGFKGTLNQLCYGSFEAETTTHNFLCYNF